MGELKQHPLPMTIDEQIKNLKSLGLIIENEEYAKKILNEVLKMFTSTEVEMSLVFEKEAAKDRRY